MPVESCTQAVCDLSLRFGEDDDDGGSGGGMVRVPMPQFESMLAWSGIHTWQVYSQMHGGQAWTGGSAVGS